MKTSNRLKILLIVEQCNPEWTSVPLVGYRFFHEISKLADVTLVTHDRNQSALEKCAEQAEIIYISESTTSKNYHRVVEGLVGKAKVIWPLYHTLSYPIYDEFNQGVYRTLKDRILSGEFDVVHAMTPMMPRYPVKAVELCDSVPFLLGPVNGGVPFPEGFRDKARQEHASLNFLRAVGRALLPGYVETYKKADRILAGSTYTLNLLKDMFQLPSDRISLFYENGVLDSFFELDPPARTSDVINLLFVGRLVPYKCADILLDAIARLAPTVQTKVRLTIVGDGPERANLEQKVQTHNLGQLVRFTGWISQSEIQQYYRQADIFCFPSIREFGGAVVLEAMACGLPCIVANNGGIGEYVTDDTGFRIEPLSKPFLTKQLTAKIQLLVEDEGLRRDMAAKSIARAQEFRWQYKAQRIVDTYRELVAKKQAAKDTVFAATLR